ncbi:uncharacterized protein BT62DRAFT_925017 [Guyanagaster necrorhizus]|uniref:Uncharacterized protein n=1 Tax=Guyanagaster necrorhizus TaxID=856835 RepID=A0A9P7W5D4_9AGAR|nr:uncharacterized protein BT62DRAFT_925017 [Guyanagaster necrorhizus MCA 3950]KAG7452457.1 hypothetical protein BT62DRAFT_925017 [Guyanagaster necrorhizus MCA 3950]
MGYLNDVVHFSGGSTSLIQDNAAYTRFRPFIAVTGNDSLGHVTLARVRVNALGDRRRNTEGSERKIRGIFQCLRTEEFER